MKRFILFSFPDYYPSGGLGDVKMDFDTKEEFDLWYSIEENKYSLSDTAYLFDCETKVYVWEKPF